MLGINRKIIWHDRDPNPKPTACKHCCPEPYCWHLFLNKKSWQFCTEKKERPY